MTDDRSRWLAWYAPGRQPAPKTFELGLCLAGAVSAGSYTAGVLDFLYEALDAWSAAKLRGENVPRHEVKLRVVAGASAGGMNGAIMAASASRRFTPAAPARNRDLTTSPFYKIWVDGLSITDLLATDDLEGPKPEFRSILNARCLDVLAQSVVEFRGEGAVDPATRSWMADPFLVKLTLANLRGVPYPIRFEGATGFSHPMTLHADWIEFGASARGVVDADKLPPGAIALPDDRTNPAWFHLRTGALATGAFPGALEARFIPRDQSDYDMRFPRLDADGNVAFVKPNWSKIEDPYAFTSVDGGLFNNEPFDLAHAVLSGFAGSNPRDGTQADRAVIMVDPFADPSPLGAADLRSIGEIFPAILAAMTAQGRFKPSELALAQSASIYSRYLIAPVRADAKGEAAMATGGLGGFIGFFSRAYRHHDFLLGRANCQEFLRERFTVPDGNPIVAGDPAMKDQRYRSRNAPDHVRLIPLIGDCAADEALPPWPRKKFAGFSEVETPLRKRVRLVAQHLLTSFLDEKEILKVTAPLIVPVIERKLAAKVAAALDAARDKVDSSSAR
jgi:hypothetical protein